MSGFSSEGLERLSDALKGYVDRGEIPGLVALVARGDDVHVDAFGVQDLSGGKPMVRDSLFRISSMTKPMTAAVAMMLVQDRSNPPRRPDRPLVAGNRRPAGTALD